MTAALTSKSWTAAILILTRQHSSSSSLSFTTTVVVARGGGGGGIRSISSSSHHRHHLHLEQRHYHRHHRPFSTRPFGAASSSSSSPRRSAIIMTTTTAAAAASVTPPIPRRDESRVVHAGIGLVPEGGWDAPAPIMPIRQSNDSSERLMDPSEPISDPYGWMRDDERSDGEVLDYLREENEYSKKVTEHLGGLQDELYGEFLSG